MDFTGSIILGLASYGPVYLQYVPFLDFQVFNLNLYKERSQS